jgi:hypothetical protein
MSVVILPEFGPDASPMPTQVGLDLSVNGSALLSESVAITQTTSEPNGVGCGEVTRGSATVSIATDAG